MRAVRRMVVAAVDAAVAVTVGFFAPRTAGVFRRPAEDLVVAVAVAGRRVYR